MATRVYGQSGSFTTDLSNVSGVTANSLLGPTALALDASNGLYVSDSGNDRVLYFPSGTTTASRVYGQLGSFTNSIVDPRNITADTLNTPNGILLDKNNGLYIADTFNSRVLYFSSGSIVPSKVYGQTNFTSGSSQTTSASSLGGPADFAMDVNGGLYISDGSRVVYYPSGSSFATKVYGQGGSFTTSTANKGGISANSLNSTTGIALDADEKRRNDLDGRGTLSEEAFIKFCNFFLKICIDQIEYMASLLNLENFIPRIQRYTEIEIAAGRLPIGSFNILRESLLFGELQRGRAPELTGYKERAARNIVSALLKKGLLVSENHKATLRLAFPFHVIEHWFPRLYPALDAPTK